MTQSNGAKAKRGSGLRRAKLSRPPSPNGNSIRIEAMPAEPPKGTSLAVFIKFGGRGPYGFIMETPIHTQDHDFWFVRIAFIVF